MIQSWYLIDNDGLHPINHSGPSVNAWTQTKPSPNPEIWPAFTQLAVDASADDVQRALRELASENSLLLEDITQKPEQWNDAIYIVADRHQTLIGEPHTDLDDCILQAPVAETLMKRLNASGAFFGYDPATETLHLTVFREGIPVFAWADSTQPGPSYALTFHTDGTCTHEDPRHFALQKLGIPATSSLLDRYDFVESQLRALGLDPVCPDLQEKQIAAVLRIKNDD